MKQENNWEEQFDSAFNWADQVKSEELERWRIMYGFVPNDIKVFIADLLTKQKQEFERARNSGRVMLQEGRNSLKAELREKTFKLRDKYDWACDHTEGIAQNAAYNEALDDTIALLDQVK